jgi:hypothetical protein
MSTARDQQRFCGRELMRKLLQEHLESRGPGKSAQPVRSADGVDCSPIRLQGRTLETIFGTVSIERAGYGQAGSRSLHPLDAELNLPEKKYSLELSRHLVKDRMEVTRECPLVHQDRSVRVRRTAEDGKGGLRITRASRQVVARKPAGVSV